jgi:hypothetical protein
MSGAISARRSAVARRLTGKASLRLISNQIGNKGMLTGFIRTTNQPAVQSNPDFCRRQSPAPAASGPAVTDPDFTFQTGAATWASTRSRRDDRHRGAPTTVT